MTLIDSVADTECPVARTAAIAGDPWSLLVLRELFLGSHRFDEIQAQSGATPQMTAARLRKLEANGLVERRTYSRRPPRQEYHLTEKGADFFQVVMALRSWGEKWLRQPGEERAIAYTHVPCGQPAGLGPLCDHCGQLLKRGDLTASFSPATIAEREARKQAAKGK